MRLVCTVGPPPRRYRTHQRFSVSSRPKCNQRAAADKQAGVRQDECRDSCGSISTAACSMRHAACGMRHARHVLHVYMCSSSRGSRSMREWAVSIENPCHLIQLIQLISLLALGGRIPQRSSTAVSAFSRQSTRRHLQKSHQPSAATFLTGGTLGGVSNMDSRETLGKIEEAEMCEAKKKKSR